MPETIRYSTTVTSVGLLVPDFIGQGMLIIFGDGAPAELHDLCALHTPDVKDGGVRPGDHQAAGRRAVHHPVVWVTSPTPI